MSDYVNAPGEGRVRKMYKRVSQGMAVCHSEHPLPGYTAYWTTNSTYMEDAYAALAIVERTVTVNVRFTVSLDDGSVTVESLTVNGRRTV
jgi:hypothetical protein